MSDGMIFSFEYSAMIIMSDIESVAKSNLELHVRINAGTAPWNVVAMIGASLNIFFTPTSHGLK